MITGLIVTGTGLVVGAFGAGIYRGHTQLIAGYDPERVTDESGLAAFVGRYVLAVGAFVTLFGVGELGGLVPEAAWVWFVFTAIIIAVTTWIAVGARQFQST